MSNKSMYILTGDIHSGKTTAIKKWIDGKNDMYGILTPVINGKRFFVDIHTKEQFGMEAKEDETDILEIGRFRFSNRAFEKASAIIRSALQQPSGWLVVDEIGPLELKQKGFHDVIKEISSNKNPVLKKLFVVRRSLIEEVISFYQFSDYTIITSLEDI